MMTMRGNYSITPSADKPTGNLFACFLLLLALGFAALLQCVAPAAAQASPAAGGLVPVEARSHNHAAIITVRGPVDQITFTSVQRRVLAATKAGASLLILRINSIGGVTNPALATARLLRSAGVPTVAYISGSALGPSLLIAASCDKIIMAPGAMLGDGDTLRISGSAGKTLASDFHAKVASPIAASLDKDAAKGYPLLILLGMVDRAIKIDEVENGRDGARKFLTPKDRRALFAVPAGKAAASPKAAAVDRWRFVRRVKEAGTLLTVDARDAASMGLSSATVRGHLQLRTTLRITGAKIDVLHLDFLESLARWLSTPTVRFFLFVIMLVCGYMEFANPGITIPGGVAVLALILLLGGPLITGLAGWGALAMVALGVVIILFDIVHFGGIGVLAAPGLLLVAAGIVASFIPPDTGSLDSNANLGALRTGVTVTTLGLLTGGAIILVLMRYLKVTPGLRRFAIAAGQAPDVAALYAKTAPRRDVVFPGAVGRAVTDLRPAGKARFGDDLVDVMAENEYISAGSVVTVAHQTENRTWVRPANAG